LKAWARRRGNIDDVITLMKTLGDGYVPTNPAWATRARATLTNR
jgi:hypothetical protein